jgi:hypothetical protein
MRTRSGKSPVFSHDFRSVLDMESMTASAETLTGADGAGDEPADTSEPVSGAFTENTPENTKGPPQETIDS